MPEPTVKPDRPPVPMATPILSFSPVTFEVPGRQALLEMRVVVPATGDRLPVILLSHGHGSSNFIASMRGYGPLVDFYASHGFVVIIPTHENSKTLGLDTSGPEGPLFWKSRPRDMSFIIDHLDEIETTVPGLAGRIDRSRIAAVGHSLGGHTVAMLAGMRVKDPASGDDVDVSEPRISAAVLFSPPGSGSGASAKIAELYPALVNSDFSGMTTPCLVVTGDKDINPMFSERADWRADAFRIAPGPKSLLSLNDAGHIFGGISGYDAAETSDESPERVAEVQRITWAYLRTALYPDDPAWSTIKSETENGSQGRIESK
ncbi:chlorophyllase-like protein [Breoghania corrubedonensis]|uniref:Chlorophyllase-like protein n=1 Tax=Breoghania corrubedonensis TaxID=665038 RepID=A0A2T5V9S9_9HYPH|nr:alpha/beta fold hydrolase [Breoghania corrubedonensis]PTW60508.1 chlorophyllase-like protein [Breoghania corrubedonensis]